MNTEPPAPPERTSDASARADASASTGMQQGARLVPPNRKVPLPRELDDYAVIRSRVERRLADVRSTAEAWKTGMSGLLGIVTAFLFFKGESTIRSYDRWAQVTITISVLIGLSVGVIALWKFISAANSRLDEISTDEIRAAGGVLPYDLQLANKAVADLNEARTLMLLGAGILAAVIVFSWFAPLAVT